MESFSRSHSLFLARDTAWNEAAGSARRKEFLEHAEFLLRDFREHRSGFTPCIRPHT